MLTSPLTFVTWLWEAPIYYRSHFRGQHVNILKRMVDAHYPDPHRFLCVTSMWKGLDSGIEVIKPWNDFASLAAPTGARNPSCYRRLRNFHPEIGSVFGDRFVSMDLDLVILDDLRPVLHRPEDFVIWSDTNPRTYYNGSLVLMNAGARPQVWTTFDPRTSPGYARTAGHFGSDQGWISYCLGPGEATWTTKDGVYSFQKHCLPNRGGLKCPEGARIVIFHGHVDPDSSSAQRIPWVREHYV